MRQSGVSRSFQTKNKNPLTNKIVDIRKQNNCWCILDSQTYSLIIILAAILMSAVGDVTTSLGEDLYVRFGLVLHQLFLGGKTQLIFVSTPKTSSFHVIHTSNRNVTFTLRFPRFHVGLSQLVEPGCHFPQTVTSWMYNWQEWPTPV